MEEALTSFALDFATVRHALVALEKEAGGNSGILTGTGTIQQELILNWLKRYRDDLPKMDRLTSLASRDIGLLNALLREHGFDIQLEDRPGTDIGVVSIIDMLLKWLTPARTQDIVANGTSYPGIVLKNCHVYATQDGDVAMLPTESGDCLWLYMPLADRAPQDGFDLIKMTSWLHQLVAYQDDKALYRAQHQDVTVRMPMLSLNLQPDITWLKGMKLNLPGAAPYIIDQALQQFILRLNEVGVHVQVATAMTALRGIAPQPRVLVFDRPFVGWFTQAAVPGVPICAFFADTDCWKNPGSIE